jgi:GNAT superfamily N-acetyltransferase
VAGVIDIPAQGTGVRRLGARRFETARVTIVGVIEIREARSDDRAFIESMAVEAINWDPTRPALGPQTIAAEPTFGRYLAGWLRPDDLGVVAEADGVAVGAAWLRFFDANEPGYGFITADIPEISIGVRRGWRGQGIGGRLLDRLIDLARARRIGALSLSVEPANPAKRLYERHGFRPVASNGDAVTMRLDLD